MKKGRRLKKIKDMVNWNFHYLFYALSEIIVDQLFLLFLQVVSFTNILIMTTNFIPILLSFYIGSWSDRFGRKPFIGAALSISISVTNM